MYDKILFGIITIIFNAYGVPCFMAGKVKAGILRIVLSVVTFGVIGIINTVMGIIQGVKILRISDAEFAEKKDTLFMGVPSVK